METKALTVTEQKLSRVKAEIALADALVAKVLEPGIDYGLHPGTNSQVLKDPGSNTIINAFNCYPQARVLYRDVTEERISYVIDISLISRDDGLAKSTGTGAASTKETRYGYRWVADPEAYGYDRAGLKKRVKHNREEFRIVNPEWSELENTIVKMARKRAEVDAAMALPGVSRFLAKLNSLTQPARKEGPPSEDWSGFWPRVRAMGLSDDEAYQLLGVSSIKDWVAQGKTKNDAIRKLSEELDKVIEEQEE